MRWEERSSLDFLPLRALDDDGLPFLDAGLSRASFAGDEADDKAGEVEPPIRLPAALEVSNAGEPVSSRRSSMVTGDVDDGAPPPTTDGESDAGGLADSLLISLPLGSCLTLDFFLRKPIVLLLCGNSPV